MGALFPVKAFSQKITNVTTDHAEEYTNAYSKL